MTPCYPAAHRADPTSWAKTSGIRRSSHPLAWIATLMLIITTGCAATTSSTPLFERLGGMDGVRAIAQELVQRISTDPRTARTFEGVDTERTSEGIAVHLCQVSDGPCRYLGGSMAQVHRDLDITQAEFAVTVAHLRDVLDTRVGTREKNELLVRLAPLQRSIATGPHGGQWAPLKPPDAR